MDYYDLLADWDSTYQQDTLDVRVAAEETHPRSHDSLAATGVAASESADEAAPIFTEREWARLRFLRELVHTGRLSEWDVAPADQSVR